MTRSEMQAEERRAIALEESGQLSTALEIWMRLARERPTAGFHCRAGGVLQSLGKFAEAEAAFRAARELDPNLSLATLGLASSLMGQGRFSEAVSALDCLRAEQQSALSHDLRGNALMDMERYEEALESFNRAVALDQGLEEAFYNIGWLLRNTDEAAAQRAFSKAVELDSSYGSAHRELGWILRKQNQLEAAEDHLRQSTELNPDDSWAWVYLGNVLWGKGEFRAARDAIERAHAAAPDEWHTNWELASFHEDAGQPEAAARFYHKALQVAPDESTLLFSYGRFLLKQGDRQNAERYLRRACEVEPGYDKARHLLHELTGAAEPGK
jgi:tetratricopeptide (TPR) repeat protein